MQIDCTMCWISDSSRDVAKRAWENIEELLGFSNPFTSLNIRRLISNGLEVQPFQIVWLLMRDV